MSDLGRLSSRDLAAYMEADDNVARQAFRAAFRRSLYLLTKIVVCWNEEPNLMAAHVFKERSDWIQWIMSDHKRGLLEDPRSYIKSTSCTRSGPLWCAIQRTDERYDAPSEIERASAFLIARPHLKGVDSRLTLIGDSMANMIRFSGSIRAIVDTNAFFRWCYPELLWDNPRRADRSYTDPEWTLPGRLKPEEPNPFVRTAGVETKVTGGRSDGIWFNDLVGDSNWNSAIEMEKRRSLLATAPMILENRDPDSPQGGFIIVEGNRWSLDDMNSVIHDDFERWSIWRRSVWVCASHGRGSCGRWGTKENVDCAPTTESLWPERYPDANALARLEADTANNTVWAAQYLNDPRAAANISEGNLRSHIVEVRAIETDQGIKRGWCVIDDGNIIPLASMEPHVISVDVASSDEPSSAQTCITWVSRDPITSRRYVNNIRAGHWAADSGTAEEEFLKMWDEVVAKTGRTPRWIVERVAAQTYLVAAIKRLAFTKNIRMTEPILAKPAKGVKKEDRIKGAVGTLLSQELLSVRAGLPLPGYEVRHFPTGPKDFLDSMSQAEIEVFAQRIRTTDEAAQREARRENRRLRVAHGGTTGALI